MIVSTHVVRVVQPDGASGGDVEGEVVDGDGAAEALGQAATDTAGSEEATVLPSDRGAQKVRACARTLSAGTSLQACVRSLGNYAPDVAYRETRPPGTEPRTDLTWLQQRPIAGVIAGAMCIAFSAVLVRLSDAAPVTVAIYRCAYALPLLGLLTLREHRRHGPRPARLRLLAAAAGVCFAADLIAWHYAIEAVGAGLATVLGNLQVLLVALLAWVLLGERPDRRLFVALPVVVIGVVGVSGVIGAGAYGENPALGVVLGAVTSAAYAGFILILRHGAADERGPVAPLFEATAVAAIVSLVVGLAAGNAPLVPTWPSHGWLLILALTSQVAGWLLISVSLPRLPAAITSMLLLLQPVGALVVAGIVLAERPSAVQLLGALLILAGVLITARRRDPAPPDRPANSAEVVAVTTP